MSAHHTPIAVFRLGRIVATPNALEHVPQPEILRGLQRHQAADWGDVDDEDQLANDRALVEGTRLLSVYHTSTGLKFWIITEADRYTLIEDVAGVVASFESKDRALQILETLARDPSGTPDGPIKLGGAKTLSSPTIIGKLAGIYLGAFRASKQTMPYFTATD